MTRAAAVLVAVVALASYAGQLEIARQYVIVTVPAAMVLSLVGRRMLRKRLSLMRSRGQCLQRTVVIGRADAAADLIAQIQSAPGHGMEVVAACVSNLDTRWTESSHLEGVPVFGFPEEALSAVDLFDAEVVAVTSHPDLVGQSLRRLAWSLEERDVDLVVSPGILEVAGPRLSIRPAAGMPLLHVERPVMAGSRRVVKSLVDKVLTIGLILAALPALVLVGLLGAAGLQRADLLPPKARRRPGRGVRHDRVPHDGRRRGGAAGGAGRPARRQRGAVQDEGRPPRHPGRQVPAPVLRGRCRSWLTSSRARCPWSVRDRRFRARSPATSRTRSGACGCVPA